MEKSKVIQMEKSKVIQMEKSKVIQMEKSNVIQMEKSNVIQMEKSNVIQMEKSKVIQMEKSKGIAIFFRQPWHVFWRVVARTLPRSAGPIAGHPFPPPPPPSTPRTGQPPSGTRHCCACNHITIMENIESSSNIFMDINFKILQSKYFNVQIF